MPDRDKPQPERGKDASSRDLRSDSLFCHSFNAVVYLRSMKTCPTLRTANSLLRLRGRRLRLRRNFLRIIENPDGRSELLIVGVFHDVADVHVLGHVAVAAGEVQNPFALG